MGLSGRSWIHSLGASARVVAPKRLAQAILDEINEAREQYQPRLKFEMLRMVAPDAQSTILPLLEAEQSKAS